MTRNDQRKTPDRWLWSAVGVGGILAVSAAVMALLRFHAVGNENFDIAFYTRVVWGMAHGDRMNSILGAHDLGLHFMPIMWVFVPFARFLPIPETLLVVHSLALGAVAPLLFALGRRLTGRPIIGLALALSWVFHPSTLQLGCREFHPGTLALPFLMVGLDRLHARRHRRAFVWLFVACLAREDVSLVVAGAGAALWLSPGQRRIGMLLLFGGLFWFLIYSLAIQPAYLPETGSIGTHFSGCGQSVGQVVLFLLSNPEEMFARLFSTADVVYLAVLVLILAGLPLFGPSWLLAAVPPLAVNLLSDFPGVLKISSHYVTLVLPGLFMATAVGVARVLSWGARMRRLSAVLGAMLVISTLAAHGVYGATPLGRHWSSAPYRLDRNEGILAWYARAIDRHPHLSVAAPSAVLNHLAERRHVYAVAFDHPMPDVAILDMRHRQWIRLAPERFNTPMEREIQRLDRDPSYGTWRFNPPYRVAWKGKPGGENRLSDLSPGRLPETATPQSSGWGGVVDLVGLEARLSYEREEYSGQYRKHIVVRTTFFWRARRPLPAGLLVKVVVEGTRKTHTRYLLPTWGKRDTATWRPGEIIRDDQWFVSPGGWPLEALSATVQLVRRNGTPYPSYAMPVRLRW